MNYKFKYAAGLPGYGINGLDGSMGVSGLSMYVFNGSESGQKTLLESRIKNNLDLSTGLPLPDGRKYQDGDFFVDNTGKIFTIYHTTTGQTYDLYYSAGSSIGSPIFLESIVQAEGNIYMRHANIVQADGVKKLVDTVFGNNQSYFSYPSGSVYGINPLNYGQIFHSSKKVGDYNPYFLYNTDSFDLKDALALVRHSSGQFRLGNADSAGVERIGTKLNFDIDWLSKTKSGVQYGILSRYDLDASVLFGPGFDSDPNGLIFNQDGSIVTVSWEGYKLLGLNADDSTINTNLVVYPVSLESPITNTEYTSNIVQRVNPSGSLTITGLDENIEYGAYIEFDKNGWVRRTKKRVDNFVYIKFDPNPITAAGIGDIKTILVDSNVSATLQTIPPTPTWITGPPSTIVNGNTITINVAAQADYAPAREGNIVYTSGGISRTIKIYQEKAPVQYPDSDYDSGWVDMVRNPTTTNNTNQAGFPWELKVRRLGNTVFITGYIALATNNVADSIIASIPYTSLGGATCAPLVNIWCSAGQGGHQDNDIDRGAILYVPKWALFSTDLTIKVRRAVQYAPIAVNISYICGI